MRILHLVHQYVPERVGGTEAYTQALAQGLAERGHQVGIFYRSDAPGKGVYYREERGTHIWGARDGVVNPTRRFGALFGQPLLEESFRQVVREFSPQIVHLQHLMGLPLALIRTIQAQEIPWCITLHDYWWVCANAQLLTNYSRQVCAGPRACINCARCALARADQAWLAPALPALAAVLAWRNLALRKILSAAHYLIAPTEFVANWYAHHGIPTGRTVVIPHGILRGPARDRPPEPPHRPLRIAYIGSLAWQKGVHTLVQAFDAISDRAELWIAGDASGDPAYVRQLQEGASPQVRFLGRLTRDQVWDTLAQVDVLAVPSLWYEAFSLVAHEAFAAGVPVLASRLGALAEVVHHEVDGLLVSSGDVGAWGAALQRLVEEPTLLTSWQSHICPPLTLDEHTGRIASLYSAALSGRGMEMSHTSSPKR